MGADNVDDASGYTIEIDEKKELSDLSRLVYMRAHKEGCKKPTGDGSGNPCDGVDSIALCKQMHHDHPKVTIDHNIINYDEKGFPDLSDTYLTSEPTCLAAGSSAFSGGGLEDSVYDTGEDMEGILSREKFRIKEDMTIGDGSTWLDAHFLAASPYSFERATLGPEETGKCCVSPDCRTPSFAGPDDDTGDDGPKGPHYTAFIETEFCRDRTKHNLQDSAEEFLKSNDDNLDPERTGSTPVDEVKVYAFCKAYHANNSEYPSLGPGDLSEEFGSDGDVFGGGPGEGPVTQNVYMPEAERLGFEHLEGTIELYEGDRGYIQVNKAKEGKSPQYEGESSDRSGQMNMYPIIVLTHTNTERASEDPGVAC